MSFLIASSIGSGMATATGRSTQSHLVYAVNQGAWWIVYLSSTNQLSFLYSTNSGATWTAPTGSPFTLVNPHYSTGVNFSFFYENISGNDIFHMCSSYYNNFTASTSTYHARFTLGTTLTNTNSEVQTGIGVSVGYSQTPYSGCNTTLDSNGLPFDVCPFWNVVVAHGNFEVAQGSNDDSGTSWTSGFGSPVTVATSTNYVTSNAIFSLGSGNLIAIVDNATSIAGNFTNLVYATWNGSAWSGTSNVFGSNVTGADTNAWGACARSTSDIHLVALSDNSSNYIHYRFNGSSWSVGDTIGSLVYDSDSGISVVSDGTYVYAAVCDNGGSNTVKVNKWTSGTGWGGWVSLAIQGFSPQYIIGCCPSSSLPMFAWTQINGGSTYDIYGAIYAPLNNLYDSDSSSLLESSMNGLNASDSQSAYESIYFFSSIYSNDQPSSTELLYVSSSIFSPSSGNTDSGFASDSFILSVSIFTYDSPSSKESNLIKSSMMDADQGSSLESWLNTLGSDTDSGSTLESQYMTSGITDAYQFDADSANASEGFTVLSSIILFESAMAVEANTLSTSSFSTLSANTDYGTGIETQQLAILDSNSGPGFNSGYASEIQLTNISPTVPEEYSYDLTSASDTQYFLSSVFSLDSELALDAYHIFSSMWQSDQSSATLENQIPIRSGGTESASEFEFWGTTTLSSESPSSLDSMSLSKSFILTDQAVALNANYLTSTLQIQADAATGMDQSLLIQYGTMESSSDTASASEAWQTIVTGLQLAFPSDVGNRSILSAESASAIDQYWLFNSMITAASAVVDYGSASEAYLKTLLPSDSASALESGLTEQIGSDASYESETYSLLNSIVTASSGVVDSGMASEAFYTIITGQDGAYGIDSLTGVITDLTPSANSLVDVYWAILTILANAGFLPTVSWVYVINPEDPDAPWPTLPPPFVMIEPLSVDDHGDQVGGGRYNLVWTVNFKVHIVVQNILDQAWQDTTLVTSYDQSTGIYEVVDQVINVLCQTLPLNPQGLPAVAELPYVTAYGAAYRNKKAGDYPVVPITFTCTYRENLPDNLP